MKKNRYIALKIFSILFFAVLGLAAKPIDAQEADSSITLEVSPPVSYFHAPPGTSQVHTITIQNLSQKTITTKPKIVDFTVVNQGSSVLPLETLSFPFIDVANAEQELSIPAGKRAQLNLTIDVPNDAAEKEYPLTILFFTKEDNMYSNSASNSKINAAVASNLIVLVAKQNTQQKLLKVTQIEKNTFFDSFSPLTFSPLIANESFAAHQITGTVQISNWKKQVIAEFELHPDIVLGNGNRIARAINPETQEPMTLRTTQRWLLGPLQIKTTLIDQDIPIDTYTVVVYAFPFKAIGALLILTLAGTYVYKKYQSSKIE